MVVLRPHLPWPTATVRSLPAAEGSFTLHLSRQWTHAPRGRRLSLSVACSRTVRVVVSVPAAPLSRAERRSPGGRPRRTCPSASTAAVPCAAADAAQVAPLPVCSWVLLGDREEGRRSRLTWACAGPCTTSAPFPHRLSVSPFRPSGCGPLHGRRWLHSPAGHLRGPGGGLTWERGAPGQLLSRCPMDGPESTQDTCHLVCQAFETRTVLRSRPVPREHWALDVWGRLWSSQLGVLLASSAWGHEGRPNPDVLGAEGATCSAPCWPCHSGREGPPGRMPSRRAF